MNDVPLFVALWLLAGAIAAARYADTPREERWFMALGPLTFIAMLVGRKEQRR